MKLYTKDINIKAFTLVEMLIVMSIFIILFGMGISAFSGLRNNVLINENSQNIQQDIRWAQRSALLLRREPDEKWLYGIGLDIRELSSTGNYKIFKWCSPFNEFDDGGAKTSSDFPNYDPTKFSGALGSANGNLDTNGNGVPEYSVGTKCPQTDFSDTFSGELIQITSRISGNEIITDPTQVEPPLKVGWLLSDGTGSRTSAEVVAFIVFESVTGNTFFYNSSGKLLNYNSNGTLISSPFDVRFAIVTPQGRSGTLINIGYNSGKVTTTSLTDEQIKQLEFDKPGSTGGGGTTGTTTSGGKDGSGSTTSGGKDGSGSTTSGSKDSSGGTTGGRTTGIEPQPTGGSNDK